MSGPTSAIHTGNGLVHAVGEFDLATIGILRAGLLEALEARPAAIVLDLSEVTFIDAAAIGVIAELRAAAERWGIHLAIYGAEGVVKEILQLTGLLTLSSEQLGSRRRSRLAGNSKSGPSLGARTIIERSAAQRFDVVDLSPT